MSGSDAASGKKRMQEMESDGEEKKQKKGVDDDEEMKSEGGNSVDTLPPPSAAPEELRTATKMELMAMITNNLIFIKESNDMIFKKMNFIEERFRAMSKDGKHWLDGVLLRNAKTFHISLANKEKKFLLKHLHLRRFCGSDEIMQWFTEFDDTSHGWMHLTGMEQMLHDIINMQQRLELADTMRINYEKHYDVWEGFSKHLINPPADLAKAEARMQRSRLAFMKVP